MRAHSFATARNWEKVRTPRSLAMALASEVGEHITELQWLSDSEASPEKIQGELRDRIASEAADVLLYLIQFADVCHINLLDAAHVKISHNETRYPIASEAGVSGADWASDS
jgi:NTP pyrophosphatase (non-canonical NTP hydrolase)